MSESLGVVVDERFKGDEEENEERIEDETDEEEDMLVLLKSRWLECD